MLDPLIESWSDAALLSESDPHRFRVCESVFSSPDELDRALVNWDVSGAEFLVAFSGAGALDDVLVSVRRGSNLLDRVLALLIEPIAAHNGELAALMPTTLTTVIEGTCDARPPVH
jgi:hypothetical protein